MVAKMILKQFFLAATLLIGQCVSQDTPTGVSVALNDHQGAVLGWRNPMSACNGGEITHYETELHPTNNDSSVLAETIPVNDPGLLGSYTVENLIPYTNYTFRVRVRCDDNSTSNFSQDFVFLTNEGKPDSPSATTNFTATTITLFISPPANPNGVVINYRIELTDESSVTRIINTGSADTEFNITDLSPFMVYNISLQAENGAIASLRLSDPFELTLRTAEAPSSQPLMVQLNAADAPSPVQLSIEWTAPTSPNGVILFYRVMWDAMTENTTDDTPSHVITGLTPFTNYTITVAAVNGAGLGNSSESVVLQTAESIPTPPLNLIGAAINSSAIRLQWDPPTVPNGIIIQYVVQYSDGMNSDTLNVSAPQTTVDVEGLSSNTTYNISVSAENSAHQSPQSNQITVTTSVTDPAPPSEPLNLMSSPMPLSVSLTWDLPLHTDNLLYYTVQFEPPPSNDTFNTTERNFTVTGLIPETMYTFTVTSIGVNGTIGGMAQVTGTTTTPMLMMPMDVNATATSTTTINVRWVQPSFMNTIDDYFISWEPFGLPDGVVLQGGMEEIQCASVNTPEAGMPNCTDVMEFDITGLEEFVNYRVTVIASNDAGNSTSGTDTALTLSAIPDGVVPNITTTEITYNSISLYWEMIPYLTRNGPNIRYIITLQEQGSSDPPRIITRATNTAFIGGLTSLTTYEIFITASNSEGNAMVMSQTVQFTTLARLPGSVSNIVVLPSADATAANISWDAAPLFDANTDISYVVIVYDTNGTIVWSGATTGLEVMVTGLAQYIGYTVTIIGRTSGGDGPSASMSFYTRQEVPAATVGNIQGSVSDNGLTVTFDTLTDPNDARGNVSYMVCYTLDGETQSTCVTTASSPVTIPGVPRGRAYTITVTPETIAGVGTESQATFVDDRPPLNDSELALTIVLGVVVPVVAIIVILVIVVVIIVKACG